MRPSARVRAGAWLAICVFPVLWFTVLRPQLPSPALGEVQWERGLFRVPAYLPGDCPYYRAAIDSLLRDGDLDLRDDAPWSSFRASGNVSVAQNGAWVPKHPILMPLVALPLYAVAGDAGLLAFNVLQLLALDIIVLWLALRVARPRVAFPTALFFALGTMLRPLAFNFSPDVFSTLLVAGGMLALMERRLVIAGALLGLSVAAKWTNLVFLVPAAAFTIHTGGWRGTLRLGAAAPMLFALAALNWHWFGSPLVTPYDRVLSSIAQGLPVLEVSHRQAFDGPFWHGLWTQLTDPSLGLIVSAPPVLIAAPGFLFMWRRARTDTLLLASSVALQMALFAPYRHWAASMYGHRFLLSAIVLCAPAAAVELERLLDGVIARGAASPSPGPMSEG